MLEYPSPPGARGYAAAADLLAADDRPELDVRVPRWKQTIRVKALSLLQQEKIEQAARTKDGGRDPIKFAVATLQEAVLTPRLDSGQAQALAEKHAATIQELVNLIWIDLSTIDQDMIDAAIRSMADLPAESGPDAPATDAGVA